MGGRNSEINPATVDVLIESACFKPQNIRATSKKLDTAHRFLLPLRARLGHRDMRMGRTPRRPIDPANRRRRRCSNRPLTLIPIPLRSRQIPLRFAKCDQLLGVAIPAEEQVNFLQRLQLSVVSHEPSRAVFQIPSFRVDLKREADLIEEIGRLYGVDKIPATPPRGAIGANAFDAVHDEIAEARRLLAGLGLNEAQGQTLISEAAAKLAADPVCALVTLRYPLSGDMNTLRPSLLPGLIESLRYNISRKNNDVAIFEIGRVFSLQPDKTVQGTTPPGAGHDRRAPAVVLGAARSATPGARFRFERRAGGIS